MYSSNRQIIRTLATGIELSRHETSFTVTPLRYKSVTKFGIYNLNLSVTAPNSNSGLRQIMDFTDGEGERGVPGKVWFLVYEKDGS